MRVIRGGCWSVAVCCLSFACGEAPSAETCAVSEGSLDGDGRSLGSVSLGHGDSCAVANDGAVVCWGDQRPTPEPLPRVGSVTHLDVGEAYKCAIRPGGSVFCWTSDDAELETVPDLCNATAV